MTNPMHMAMLTLKVISPLAIHARRANEQFVPTLDYVPGSTIRGAFADQFMAGDSQRSQESIFKQIFLSGEVSFSDFSPTDLSGNELTRMRPATAMACKRFDKHDRHSLTDSLLWLELLREKEDFESLKAFNEWKLCPECVKDGLDGKRDRAGGYYYNSVAQPGRIPIRKRMVSHTAIDRSTQTAAHGLLFSHEVIEESGAFDGQEVYLRGVIRMPLDLRHTLADLVPLNSLLAVGYGRSRGFGQLKVTSWSVPALERNDIQKRWKSLNEAAQALWHKFGLTPNGTYFSLNLQSHLALRDQAGQPVLENILPSDLGLPNETELCHCVLNAISVPGWNAAQGRPKADTWALEHGSVLLFRLPPDIDPQQTLNRLSELEDEGVGERRMEGFGSITACDPFHSEFISQYLRGGL